MPRSSIVLLAGMAFIPPGCGGWEGDADTQAKSSRKQVAAATRPEIRPDDKIPFTRIEPKPPPEKKDTNVYVSNTLGMKLVQITGGKFLMGSPKGGDPSRDQERQHDVEITRAYWLCVYEVTQKQYQKVMGGNPSFYAPGGGSKMVEGLDTINHPVEKVSWEEAVEFCRKLSELPAEKEAGRVYRLPTEAEWEYACRAGTATDYHYGKYLGAKQANFNSTVRRTREVGCYQPNALGLHDMHGNVAEWCADWFGPYPAELAHDPKGPDTGRFRVIRGGAVNHKPAQARSASRAGATPGTKLVDVGLRVAMDIEQK